MLYVELRNNSLRYYERTIEYRRFY